MNIEEYTKSVETNIQVGGDADHLEHFVLGIMDEVGETVGAAKRVRIGKPLDRVHFIEELGDFAWYFQGYLRLRGKEWNPPYVDPAKMTIWRRARLAFIAAGKMADAFDTLYEQTEGFHADQYDDVDRKRAEWDMDEYAFEVLFHMACLAKQIDATWEEIFAANHRKLVETRYKNGFSIEAMSNRDKDAERKALEGKE